MSTRIIATIAILSGCGSTAHETAQAEGVDAAPSATTAPTTSSVAPTAVAPEAGGGPALAMDSGATPATSAGGAPVYDADSGSAAADSGAERTIHLHYEDATAPGFEGMNCLDVPGPVADTWIRGWKVSRPGTHHANLWQRQTGTPFKVVTQCGSSFGVNVLIFNAPTPTVSYEMPAGDAMLLKAGASFIFDVHELNVSDMPGNAIVDVDLLVADGPPAREVRTIELSTGLQMAIPPHSQQTLAAQCTPTKLVISLISLIGHGHAHSTAIAATLDGREIYRSTTWSDPAVGSYDLLPVGAGHTLAWTCAINNTLDTTIRNGNKVQTDEMCIIFGLAAVSAPWGCAR